LSNNNTCRQGFRKCLFSPSTHYSVFKSLRFHPSTFKEVRFQKSPLSKIFLFIRVLDRISVDDKRKRIKQLALSNKNALMSTGPVSPMEIMSNYYRPILSQENHFIPINLGLVFLLSRFNIILVLIGYRYTAK